MSFSSAKRNADAASRNAEAMSRFHRQMADRARGRKSDRPRRLKVYRARVQSELLKLIPEVEKARGFLQKVDQRKDSGELDDVTAEAESLPALTVVGLASFLEVLYDQASEIGDNFALSRVNVAADSLRSRLERGLLREREYPEEQEGKEESIRQALLSASMVYNEILEILDSTPQSLGVPVPECPIVQF